MITTPPSRTAQAPNRFAVSSLFMPPSRLPDGEAETLLRQLVTERWARLSSEYDDPLGLLFSNRVRQWTAGWSTDGTRLYLLVWELTSWQEQATWRLYDNGHLIYEELDGDSARRSALCQKLLESDALPFLTQQALCQPLADAGRPRHERDAAARALLSTVLARPEIFPPLQEDLFAQLESGLGDPAAWPPLAVMQLDRMAHKNTLTWLFKTLARKGILKAGTDALRLDRALSQQEADYRWLLAHIGPLLEGACRERADQFAAMLADGPWRARLKFRLSD